MPCSDGGVTSYYDHNYSGDHGECNKAIMDLGLRNDKLARMLCHVMTQRDKASPQLRVDEEVLDWWAEHKKFDKERDGN